MDRGIEMRIAYFTESLYPLVDGVSRTLARLFATLEASGVEFEVFSPFVPGEEAGWRERVRPVPYVRFPPYPQYRVSLPFTRGVRRHLAKRRPDLVHVVSPTPMGYAAQRVARWLGVPAVGSFHTDFVSYFRYYGVRPLEPAGWSLLRAFYRGCARVYAPSRSMISELESHGLRRLELWSRGIDTTRFSPARRLDDLYPTPGGERLPVLLLVSRLVREKDLADLVQADRILRSRGVRYTVAVVGDGPMRSELETSMPHAIFAGHREGDDLARHYASADVFVFPSTTETFGNVVLEALASGLPSVVVDRGGPRDLVVDGENGYVARANDPVSLADRIQPLLEDRSLRERQAAAARTSAVDRDWESVNRALIESYAAVIAEAREAGAAA